jgi:hypothetical protein
VIARDDDYVFAITQRDMCKTMILGIMFLSFTKLIIHYVLSYSKNISTGHLFEKTLWELQIDNKRVEMVNFFNSSTHLISLGKNKSYHLARPGFLCSNSKKVHWPPVRFV